MAKQSGAPESGKGCILAHDGANLQAQWGGVRARDARALAAWSAPVKGDEREEGMRWLA